MKRIIIITLLILSIPAACCAQDAWYEARESSAVHYNTHTPQHIEDAHHTIMIDAGVMVLMNQVPSSASSSFSPSIEFVSGSRGVSVSGSRGVNN